MKITLIGASGFVGTRLITLLKKAQRYEMLNIDLQQSRFFPEVTAIGDVRDQDYLDKKLEGAECVVLLAAQHRDDVVPVSLYYDTNVGGIEKTLKAMEKNNIKRIIFFSSVAAYGLKRIQMKNIRQIRLITMGKVNGRQSKFCMNGISYIRIGILILFVQQSFLENVTEAMCTIY